MGKRDQRQSRTLVVSRHGRHRFQTGFITGTLVSRGVPMTKAFELSKRLRQELDGRKEIRTEELEQRIDALLEEAGYASAPPTPPPARTSLFRDLTAIGLDRADVATATAKGHLDPLQLPKPFDGRFRLLQWIRHADRPVIVFLAGATGTGKSSLALELGVRLGMRLVVSTDMIREVMRTVLSPDLVPGLHDHSFRGMLQGGAALSDPRERVVAGFRQQAAQVSAGVGGVIRRALREGTHMIIEGTHLQPPFDQYILGAHAYHAGLMLAVPSTKEHRTRFPERASRQHLRDAEAYLDAFQSVRWIHEDLLRQAEEADVVVLPTGDLTETVGAAFDALASLLPVTDRPSVPLAAANPIQQQDVRTLVLILDGMADEPQEALGGMTPLGAAHTPTLDRLAQAGGQGLLNTSPVPGEIPHTDLGLFSVLSHTLPEQTIGRGVVEAAGRGIPLPPGAVLFRGNLATRTPRSRSLVDRRAGRINAGVEDLLAELGDVPLAGGLRGRVFKGHEHRVILMLVGAGLSDKVDDTDPGAHAETQRIRRVQPLDESPEAARTASALRELLTTASAHLEDHPLNRAREARGELPANTILTRGAASAEALLGVEKLRVRAAMVAACPTALGVAHLLGMSVVTGQGMTGNLDTDLQSKFTAARPLLADRPLVAIHMKGTDVAAHDRRPVAKRDFIARVDEALGQFLEAWSPDDPPLRVVVTADHGTSSTTGRHMVDPVPVLVTLWDPDSDEDAAFTEASASEGALGMLGPGELASMLFDQP